MGSYHQMGHDSWNLITEKHLNNYQGIILSPVNEPYTSLPTKIANLRKTKPDIEIVLDPQYYQPASERGHLAEWPHFSDEADTVNLSDSSWWSKKLVALVDVAITVGANSICTPAVMPRIFDDDYYRWVVDVTNSLDTAASVKGIEVLVTSIVNLSELARKGRPEAIASILTSTDVSRVYLVLFDDLGPRRQREDVQALAGAMFLIKLLENAQTKVLVAFSGLDMMLWKAAGASHVATGKFFNLRRFVLGRFDDDSQAGGRVLPYWTDGELVTWLREEDVRLLDSKGFVDRSKVSSNPYSSEILEILDEGSGKAWVGASWRQYMFWFQETEIEISLIDGAAAKKMLKIADISWGKINSADIYLYDRVNTGDWIRPWLNAISAFEAK